MSNTNQNMVQDIKKLAERHEKSFIKLQRNFRHFLLRKRIALSQLKWITGLNGNYVLPGITKTDFQLVPTGKLIESQRAPEGGEVITESGGLSVIGVNQTALSGTLTKDFDLPWEYAAERPTGYDGLTLEEREKQLYNSLRAVIDDLNKYINNKQVTTQDADDLVYLTLLILRLRQLNEKLYHELHADIVKLIQKLDDPDLWLNKDKKFNALHAKPVPHKFIDKHQCFSKRFDFLDYFMKIPLWLNLLSKAVFEGPAFEWTMHDREYIKRLKPMPIVMGVPFLSKKMQKIDDVEVLCRDNLSVGKDITVFITDTENQNIVRQFLRQHNLRSKVFVCTNIEYRPFVLFKQIRHELSRISRSYKDLRLNLNNPPAEMPVNKIAEKMKLLAETYLMQYKKLFKQEGKLKIDHNIGCELFLRQLIRDGFIIDNSISNHPEDISTRPLIFSNLKPTSMDFEKEGLQNFSTGYW